MKLCTKCGQPGEFSKCRSRKDGLQPTCKVCLKAYYEANREKQLEYQRAWREANPEKQRQWTKAWTKANPDKVIAKTNRRRARKAGAAGNHTEQQWQARLSYHGGKCYYCGCDGEMTREHRIPLSRGGTDWPANLVPACQSCNSSKGTKTEFEFTNTYSGEESLTQKIFRARQSPTSAAFPSDRCSKSQPPSKREPVSTGLGTGEMKRSVKPSTQTPQSAT